MNQPQKKVFVFGNPDVEMDSLPLRLVPDLKKKFPDVSFEMLDPNEEWTIPKEMLIIDTVVGIKEITVFDGLAHFTASPNVSVHDFDAYANLRLLQKLGKLGEVKIVGIPPVTTSRDILPEVEKIVATLI